MTYLQEGRERRSGLRVLPFRRRESLLLQAICTERANPPARDALTGADQSESCPLDHPDRRGIVFADKIPKASTGCCQCTHNVRDRRSGKPATAVGGIRPGVSDLQVAGGHEGKPEVARIHTGTMDEST